MERNDLPSACHTNENCGKQGVVLASHWTLRRVQKGSYMDEGHVGIKETHRLHRTVVLTASIDCAQDDIMSFCNRFPPLEVVRANRDEIRIWSKWHGERGPVALFHTNSSLRMILSIAE